MKIIAFVICEREFYFGGLKTINSLKYFHPDIQIIHYDNEKLNYIKQKYNCNNYFYFGAIVAKEIWDNEKPDLLIKLVGDCLVLGDISRVFNENYDCAAPRNDCDVIGTRDERINRPDELINIPNDKWVNADTVFLKNEKFVNDWFELSMDYHTKKKICIDRPGKFWEGDDQQSLNIIFSGRGYNSLILDPIGSKECYGASANWNGIQDGTNWPAWKDIYFDGENCISKNNGIGYERIVKIVHQGCGGMEDKLSWKYFNPEFAKYLTKITGFDS